MSIFRVKTVLGANITGFILGTILFAMFLLLTLYMQQVLGMSPLRTGLGYLAVAGTAILWANVAALLVNRVGVKPILMIGMALMGVGLVFFTQISADGSYWSDLFPGFLIIGLGMPFVFVPVTIAAVAGVSHDEAGLASGLINTSQQIGGALGIAVLAAVANHVTTSQTADGTAAAQAAVDGFTAAFWVAAAAAAVGVAAIAVFVRRSELVTGSAPEPEGEPATATV
jgi:MFS family permease